MEHPTGHPAPRIDGLLWLRLVGMSLRAPRVQTLAAKAGATRIVTSCRVRLSDAHCPACWAMDPLSEGAPGCRRCGAAIDETQLVARGVSHDGMVRFDLEHERLADGRRTYSTTLIPVSACNDHDTEHVLRAVLASDAEKALLLTETQLALVDGSVRVQP